MEDLDPVSVKICILLADGRRGPEKTLAVFKSDLDTLPSKFADRISNTVAGQAVSIAELQAEGGGPSFEISKLGPLLGKYFSTGTFPAILGPVGTDGVISLAAIVGPSADAGPSTSTPAVPSARSGDRAASKPSGVMKTPMRYGNQHAGQHSPFTPSISNGVLSPPLASSWDDCGGGDEGSSPPMRKQGSGKARSMPHDPWRDTVQLHLHVMPRCANW